MRGQGDNKSEGWQQNEGSRIFQILSFCCHHSAAIWIGFSFHASFRFQPCAQRFHILCEVEDVDHTADGLLLFAVRITHDAAFVVGDGPGAVGGLFFENGGDVGISGRGGPALFLGAGEGDFFTSGDLAAGGLQGIEFAVPDPAVDTMWAESPKRIGDKKGISNESRTHHPHGKANYHS